MNYERNIFRLTPTPCLLIAVDIPKFTILDVNHAYLAATKTTEKDLIGRGLFEAFPDNPLDETADGEINLSASLLKVIRSKRPHKMPVQKYDIPLSGSANFEIKYWNPENIPFLNEKGEVTQILHTVTDITDCYLNKIKINEAERLYDDLFHMSPIPSWVYDVESFRFLDVNNAAITKYGYSREDFLNMTIRDIRPFEDIQIIEDLFHRYKDSQLVHYPDPIRHKRKNGEIFFVDMFTNSVWYKGKAAKIVISNDITDRLEYIKTIEVQNKTLREISWTQSHIVRAPLTRAMGCLDLLKGDSLNSEDRKKLSDYLLTSTHEFDSIIKDLVIKSQQVIPKDDSDEMPKPKAE